MQKAGKILIFVFVGFLITANFAWAGVEHNTSGYAWSENIGWISFNNASDGSAVNYGVNVDLGNGKLSGYGWSENIGWISFNESELVGCPEGECRAKATPSGQLGQSDVNIYGWARALSHGGGWDGWIRFDHGQSNEAYIDSSGNWKGWAWGSEVIGWVSFDQASSNFNVSTDVGGTGGNPLVDPASLSVSEPSSATYCGIARHKFEWLYEDDGNQSQYQIQIDNNSNFNSPEVDLTRSGLSDPPPKLDIEWITVSETPGPNLLVYDTEYWWQVKVWDEDGNNSGWVEPSDSFTTGEHPYPYVDFDWTPQEPRWGDSVQFTDNSSGYSGFSIISWLWTFQDADPSSSTEQNPTAVFSSRGEKDVKLKVTDSSGCWCEKTQSVQVKWRLPFWKEILGALLGAVGF